MDNSLNGRCKNQVSFCVCMSARVNIPNLGKTADLIPLRRKLLGRLRQRAGLGSWQEFFGNYWRFLYAVARRAGLSEVEALAAVEETIVAASTQWTGSAVGGRKGAFKAWLMELTRWRIIEQLHSRQCGSAPTFLYGAAAESAASPS